MTRTPGWYLRRLRGMSAAEVAHRVADRGRQARWAARQVRVGDDPGPVPGLLLDRRFTGTLPADARTRVDGRAGDAVVAAADRLLAGEHVLLGVTRHDLVDPDWFRDPVTGRRAPQETFAFRVDHRDEEVTGNVKSVWELSRHHHLTVLAAAWWLTGDDRYAVRAAEHLRSWWAANPFLSGVHWTSGIELGVRLVSWVWVRRLLDDWPGVTDLFEDNEAALRQVRWHHEYLAAFRSRGSSANNHVVAEAVGQLVAATAFPWFDRSERWRGDAAELLATELAANTFASGVNREQASDYHRFVTELGLVALVEAERADRPLPVSTRDLLVRSLDAAAAMVDVTGRPPRQGDGDEGRALVVDAPDADPWGLLLSTGSTLVAACDWWPTVLGSVQGALLGAMSDGAPAGNRPSSRPDSFEDAGLYLLRTPAGEEPEVWCRFDAGPHGFLSIAAHAHADALSVEVRCDGVDLLADPGTFCYHGDPAWRTYFRSTAAHNTVEVDGQSQSVEGGPFLWSTRTDASLVTRPAGPPSVVARHRGYARLDPGLVHERSVRLDERTRTVAVTDTLTASGSHQVRLSWHLGPDIRVALDGARAVLTWDHATGHRTAELRLPDALSWSTRHGDTDPVLGWYSPAFGERVPTTALVGTGTLAGDLVLHTELAVLTTAQGDLSALSAFGHNGSRESVSAAAPAPLALEPPPEWA